MRRTLRVGVTGLARSGKTTLLTSLAANLLAAGMGQPVLPALTQRLAGRRFRVAVAPSGAEAMPRFDYAGKLGALAADPPHWPTATQAVSLLSLDLEISRGGLAATLPPQRIRLELLDYPGEWLLDLPLIGADFTDWSVTTLRRLADGPAAALSAPFRNFVDGLPPRAPAEEVLARTGHELFRAALVRLRAEVGLPMLQPGRFLMPPPGPEPPWMTFFPLPGSSPLAGLLRRRFDAYREQVRRELVSPSFGHVDRLVVLADVLAALHAGSAVFAQTREALAAVSAALRWQPNLLGGLLPAAVGDWLADWLSGLVRLTGGIDRVAYVATKSDHVAERQRGNLSALVRQLVATAERPGFSVAAFAIAAVRCTEDIVWTLDGRPVSAVRGRLISDERPVRSYPGEVPDRVPDASFWEHPFLALPHFEPMRLPLGGRGGVPHINLDALLTFLLEDILP